VTSAKQRGEKILIIGAGFAGLAAAACFAQSGRSVVLVERGGEARLAMPGLLLHANALRVLASLELEAPVLARGVVLRGARLLDASGKALSEVSFQEELDRGIRTAGIPSQALKEVLGSKLTGVEIRRGVSLFNINLAPDHADAFFSDGSHGRFSLVVGADGLRSRVRELILGPIPPRETGIGCWRAVLPRPDVVKDDLCGEQLGAGVRMGWVPIGGGEIYAYFLANRPWEGTREGCLERFAGLGGPAPALLAGLGAVHFEEIRELWADPWHKGRIVLLGDAAHAMNPSLAQGAAMALEDAKALQYCLDQAEDVGDALIAFEAIRKGRVRAVHEASSDAGRVNQWSSGAAVAFRNLLYRVLPAETSRARLRALLDGGGSTRDFLGHRPDLPPLSEASLALVKFLVKVGQSDGRFDDQERSFIQASLRERGEHVSPGELESLSQELHRVPLASVLSPYQGAAEEERARLLALGHLAAMANGQVAPKERRALAEAQRLLGVPEEALERARRGSSPGEG
jgi:2-polyprenyl-6-methoxyphenol hydroxylase-like FAD-dependent oxidoreductase